VPAVVILPRADAQIIEVLAYTFERFGETKYLDYRDLIGIALRALESRPTAGKRRPEIHPDAWTYHIARPGRKARHLFIYRIRTDVEIARFIYDAMDLRRQGPPEWKPDE
jgi:plasmid stabilization system protein ParE